MADAHAKHHDYHLVDPSPWPAVGSVSAFITAVGAISWMHHLYAAAPVVFGIGMLGILYTFIAWWRDVIREAEHGGYHTRVVQISHRYGMILFIASEVMFFVAWFWAYFDAALYPDSAITYARTQVLGGQWPPIPSDETGVPGLGYFGHTFDPWGLPFVNTLILLLSGTTVTWAHHSLLNNNREGLVLGLACTVVLGEVSGAWRIPTVAGRVGSGSRLELDKLWRVAQSRASRPVRLGTVSTQLVA